MDISQKSAAAGYTPGPWQTTDYGIAGPSSSSGALGGIHRVAIADIHPAATMEEWAANARLIASAPELLAALRIELAALVEQRDTGTTILSRDARIERMRSAIAKAVQS